MADPQNNDTKPAPGDVDKAKVDAQAAQAKALDAQAKADEARKSDEQKAADKAKAEADRARSKAAEAETALVPADPMSAAEAKIVSPHLTEGMGAGDHLAQQFSNQPANPHIAKAEHADLELCTVKLTMTKADGLGTPVVTMVHPEMVGDYLRAGWSRA